MHPNFVGALIHSALYQVGVFVAGIVTGHHLAWNLALAAMGVTYISHALGFVAFDTGSRRLMAGANAVVWLSIAFGAAAGIALLF